MVSETDRLVSQPLASRYLAYAPAKSCMNSLASSPPSPGLISMIIVISFRPVFIPASLSKQPHKVAFPIATCSQKCDPQDNMRMRYVFINKSMMKKFFVWLVAASMILAFLPQSESKIDNISIDPFYTETQLDSIFLIQCKKSQFSIIPENVGTGFLINDRTIITAQHVIKDAHACSIAGVDLVIDQENHLLDYATLSIQTRGLQSLPVRCEGFTRGKNYYAIGYARGTRFTMNRLVATHRFETTQTSDGLDQGYNLRELRGTATPGMSGGPIIDEDGYVVGITIAISTRGVNRVYSRELKDTHLCKL